MSAHCPAARHSLPPIPAGRRLEVPAVVIGSAKIVCKGRTPKFPGVYNDTAETTHIGDYGDKPL